MEKIKIFFFLKKFSCIEQMIVGGPKIFNKKTSKTIHHYKFAKFQIIANIIKKKPS